MVILSSYPIQFVVFLSLFVLEVPAARAADALDGTLQTCWSCHGPSGVSNDPKVPIIWGQNATYLEKQIRDFRSGEGDRQIMSSMVEAIGRDDISRTASLIGMKPWPKSKENKAGAVPVPASVATCQGCHGADLRGGDSPTGPAPRLAGQLVDYLEDQMNEFAGGGRSGQNGMSEVMKLLKPEDRSTLANYLAAL